MSQQITKRSSELFTQAQKYIPGGVNSPVRAFRSVGATPRFIVKGRGNRIYDADGNEYIDFVSSWGPLIFGHASPNIINDVGAALKLGTSFGAPTEAETTLAKMIIDCVPSIEMLRLVNSGTEACMTAIRLARGFTGRDKILKFIGCYHGHADSLLVEAGSGLATFSTPSSKGVPQALANLTITAPYNDISYLEEIFRLAGPEIACVIVEPVAGNMGVVPPAPGFLEAIRTLTSQYGALFICDEVITGFRLGLTGAQGMYGISPDLTVLGKIIGGGLPLAAFGGRRDIMEHLSPLGDVYQAGTLSGNPLAVAAGISAIERLQKEKGLYGRINYVGSRWVEGLSKLAKEKGIPVTINSVGSMSTLFFTEGPVTDFASASKSDTQKYALYFRAMLEAGVYLAPSQFEAAFISAGFMLLDEIDDVLEIASKALDAVKEAK
ncbi:MAG: glutamate-1-semialdehyde 2,1-aminomutase [Deltaproteobacteria bacterium]|jgi:glutamate-1-semialdehyde 2,1-aminomutase|nr:glutamate-1-semialdehyde 2,1-aminomutase [Deltaproteobacteria bacterium]